MKSRQQAHLGEAAGPEGPVAIPEFPADGAHGRPADLPEARFASEALDVAVRQAPDVRPDDERLQGPGADDAAHVGDDPTDEAGEAVTDLGQRVISPSAVWSRRGRLPLREPAASGVRS